MQKIRLSEDGWNSRDPEKVAQAYTLDSRWRNRAEFVRGRQEIVAFLTRKWAKELDYRLIKELWAFEGNRIAVRFAYEWHDDSGNWYRSYGNENWEFDAHGLMRRRYASINDLPIRDADRLFTWDRSGPRRRSGNGPDQPPAIRRAGAVSSFLRSGRAAHHAPHAGEGRDAATGMSAISSRKMVPW